MSEREAILALIADAEARRGSMYCKVTTYELRKALGLKPDNWADELSRAAWKGAHDQVCCSVQSAGTIDCCCKGAGDE